MKTGDVTADLILERTLRELRRQKQIRRKQRAAAGLGIAALGLLLTWPQERPAPAISPLTDTRSQLPSSPLEPEKLVAMVWRGGSASLEEVDASQLGDLELQFDLQPVITYGDSPFGNF